jgi:predicted secreted protein
MIGLSREIRSLILIIILLCVPVAAIEFKSKSTVHNGNAVTVSSGSSSFTSGSPSTITSKSTSVVTVKQGECYSISLNEDQSTGYKWTVVPSSGLKLLSDKLSSDGKRELKFLAVQKGQQAIKADYSKPGVENIKTTSEFILNVV